jgi:hypothetical protein
MPEGLRRTSPGDASALVGTATAANSAEVTATAPTAPPASNPSTAPLGTEPSANAAQSTGSQDFGLEDDAKASPFLKDVRALCRTPHRLAGSSEGRAALGFVEARLRDAGIREIYPLEMPVWQMRSDQVELEVDGRIVRLSPLRPNITVLPNTDPEGVTAPLIYAGLGRPVDYLGRNPRGAIVVVDYQGDDAYRVAFALGAKAVLFLDRENKVSASPKWSGLPGNQLRFYVPPWSQSTVDLTRDYARATLRSRVLWEQRRGRDLVVKIAGTAPAFASEQREPEALVVAAPIDTFGEVPEVSPGARGAANVAALIAIARRFQNAAPKRDVWLLFLDNQARQHQGAREFYEAITLDEGRHRRLVDEHEAEMKWLRSLHGALEKSGLLLDGHGLDVTITQGLARAFAQEANFLRDDVRKRAEVARLQGTTGRASNRDSRRQAEVNSLTDVALRWDEIRRALHKDRLSSFVRQKTAEANTEKVAASAKVYLPLFGQLLEATKQRFARREDELEEIIRVDRQRDDLRRGLTSVGREQRRIGKVVLHVSLDLSDGGNTWGVVVGDYTNRLFSWRTPRSDADNAGYYGRVLNALSDVARERSGLEHLDPRTLTDPNFGMTFAPGAFFSSGSIAGAYGFYNVALMTGYDRRSRDGYPGDVVAALDSAKIEHLADEAGNFLVRAASSSSLSLSSVFKAVATSKYPSFEQGQNSGDYVGLQVSGSLKEDRPAESALLAIWPGNTGWKNQAFSTLEKALTAPNFDPVALERVERTGRFRVIGLREDMHTDIMTLGSLFDDSGRVIAITTQEKQSQKLTDAMRVNLFFGSPVVWNAPSGLSTQPELLKLLSASSDSPFRTNRSLFGQLGENGFAYVANESLDLRLKLFQPMGISILGEPERRYPYGGGVPAEILASGVDIAKTTATDLFRLNEGRLRQLRERGVTHADLEMLHSRAGRERDRASGAATVIERQSGFLRSAALSHHVYLPLREAMDDLVHAIVLLLLLAIPFAFAMERLVLCATTVYGRIAGFTLAFLATFALLFWMHPGFAIAKTPAIIFLAFAIVLLTSLVIYILIRKFKNELKIMQGRSTGLHGLEISRMGTLFAAVGMGMSTMRRRKTRTTLTAITVVMLTFTILSFASFTRTVGVRASYEGPVRDGIAASILIHKLDQSAIEPSALEMLAGQEGKSGLIAPQYWVTRELNAPERLSVSDVPGRKTLNTDAVLGITPEEVERWPAFAAALGPESKDVSRALTAGEVYLPKIMGAVLGVSPGDLLVLNGRRVKCAGMLDAVALERLRHLDGRPVLPVNFQDATAAASGATASGGQKDETQLIMADEVDRNFTYLSSDQVVITSAELARALGGKLHRVAVYTADEIDAAERGRRIAELVVMPVWAKGVDGVERLVFTVITEVTGGFGLFVPLLLGGLIIFGTLLGSIGDREREIYTFSALGLAPSHVGALFLAEAAVYAVVGGMGGQILAQFVGLGASWLAKRGVIEPVSINYSSTNSLFAIGVVMLTVLVSAVYPAIRASRSANPGLSRNWQMPRPNGDNLDLIFPFTVSAYDIVGVMSFLAEHFRHHSDAGLGDFASVAVSVRRIEQERFELAAEVALAPFDLGVTETLRLSSRPSEIPGVDEVCVSIVRISGTQGDFVRANKTFLKNLRRQFLLWRTLSHDVIEEYRQRTYAEIEDSTPDLKEAS